MRLIDKAKMLEYYEEGILQDILVLCDKIVARKTAHSPNPLEPQGIEVVWCPYP